MVRLLAKRSVAGLAALGALCIGVNSAAQQGEPAALQWTLGSGTAPVGSGLAEIDLGQDYAFLDAGETRRFREMNENPVSGDELATVIPVSDDAQWFMIFEFDEIGYVPDDEKDSLDADDMLASIRQGTEAANEERRRRGWSTMSIEGWHEAPHYDPRTNNLSWAIIGESEGHRTVNRSVKLLGRRGVMTVTLVASPDELPAAMPAVDTLLAGYRFRPGNAYAEYVSGTDKLAEYGLTALVVGGAGAALIKSGLLAKFWKPLVVALAAMGAGIKRFFMGGRSSRHDPEKPIA
jgi:uncharacterized membrane-anchored protein